MSPLHIKILLHYYCSASPDDYSDNETSANITREAINYLVVNETLKVNHFSSHVPGYSLTDKGSILHRAHPIPASADGEDCLLDRD